MYRCLNCSKELTLSLLNMGIVPIANHLLSHKKEYSKTYPLEVFLCNSCKLYQLGKRVSPRVIFNNYFYHSSYSKTFLEHSKQFVKKVQKNIDFSNNKLIFEIASNDGYLLKNFDNYFNVVGIEPSKNVAEIAIRSGINTEKIFFNMTNAKYLKKKYGLPKLIIANNVLAHVPNLKIIFKSLEILSTEETIISIEFPTVRNLIKFNQFDTIYHEHYTYLCLTTIKNILKNFSLKIYNVENLDTHGGSLRLWLSKGKQDINKNVYNELNREKHEGIFTQKKIKKFKIDALQRKLKLLNFLEDCKKNNKSVYGYGAAAKGISFLNYCGKKSQIIKGIFDKNIMKQNCYIPYLKIKILNPKKIKKIKPDYLIILAWNIKDEIKKEFSFIDKWGGKFISFE